jgi:hypothetical protein
VPGDLSEIGIVDADRTKVSDETVAALAGADV